MIEYIFTLLFILVISIIDIKLKKVPAHLTTIFILLSLVFVGEKGIYLGLISFLFAFIMLETNFFKGTQDLKLIVGIGILMKSIPLLIIYFIIILIISVIYKLIIKKFYPHIKEIAFTPILVISFCMWGIFLFGGVF